jgi:hypothetical protein
MKGINFFLFIVFILFKLSPGYSAEQSEDADTEIRMKLNAIKAKTQNMINKKFPELPVLNDFNYLNAALTYTDCEVPRPLVEFHLILGNLVFAEIDLPTVHYGKQSDGTYGSALLDFIREGHHEGVPQTWIPFCQNHGAYVCIHMQTKEVRSYTSKLSSKSETFSSWLEKTFITK